MPTSTSTTSTEMRRETGEDSPDVLSAGFAVISRNRISVVEKEKVHSADVLPSRSRSPEDVDFGSQNQFKHFFSPKVKETARTAQAKVLEGKEIQGTETERS